MGDRGRGRPSGLDEKRIESPHHNNVCVREPPLSRWKEDWKVSVYDFHNHLIPGDVSMKRGLKGGKPRRPRCYPPTGGLDEKRIESRDRPRCSLLLWNVSMKRGLKVVSLKTYLIRLIWSRWKEDWKFQLSLLTNVVLNWVSMKRGLKAIFGGVIMQNKNEVSMKRGLKDE